MPVSSQCHGLESVRVLRACRMDGGGAAVVVTLCDVGAASAIRPGGTVTVRESAGSAAGPGPGAAR